MFYLPQSLQFPLCPAPRPQYSAWLSPPQSSRVCLDPIRSNISSLCPGWVKCLFWASLILPHFTALYLLFCFSLPATSTLSLGLIFNSTAPHRDRRASPSKGNKPSGGFCYISSHNEDVDRDPKKMEVFCPYYEG